MLMPVRVAGLDWPPALTADAFDAVCQRAAVEPPYKRAVLLSATFIFAGMDRTKEEVLAFFDRVDPIRESVVYQGIFERGEQAGRLEAVRELLLAQGTAKFGQPSPAQQIKLDATDNLERLKRLSVRLLKVESWDALLRGR